MKYQRAAAQALRVLGPTAAGELLWLLDRPSEVRAEAFRQLHEMGTQSALEDALAELEVDAVMRGWFAEHLRLELGLA